MVKREGLIVIYWKKERKFTLYSDMKQARLAGISEAIVRKSRVRVLDLGDYMIGRGDLLKSGRGGRR